MPKRPRKPPSDPVVAAKSILDQVTGAAERLREKNPAAVLLGRKGGEKGGKVRAARMTPKERKDSAKKAAEARWGSKRTK